MPPAGTWVEPSSVSVFGSRSTFDTASTGVAVTKSSSSAETSVPRTTSTMAPTFVGSAPAPATGTRSAKGKTTGVGEPMAVVSTRPVCDQFEPSV